MTIQTKIKSFATRSLIEFVKLKVKEISRNYMYVLLHEWGIFHAIRSQHCKLVPLRKQSFPVVPCSLYYTSCMSSFGRCIVVDSLLFHAPCVHISRIPSRLSVLIAIQLNPNKFHYIRYIQR